MHFTLDIFFCYAMLCSLRSPSAGICGRTGSLYSAIIKNVQIVNVARSARRPPTYAGGLARYIVRYIKIRGHNPHSRLSLFPLSPRGAGTAPPPLQPLFSFVALTGDYVTNLNGGKLRGQRETHHKTAPC